MPPKTRTAATRTSGRKAKPGDEIKAESNGDEIKTESNGDEKLAADVRGGDSKSSAENSRTCQEMDPQRVMMLPASLLTAVSEGRVRVLRSRHPRTATDCLFATIQNQSGQLFELAFHSTNETFCSFLIDQTIEKDGRIVTATPFDARFLVLDKLREAAKFVEVTDCFEGEMVSVIEGLRLEAIADTKEVCGRRLAKYNEERVLAWLETKVRRVAKVLRDKQISCGAIAKSKLLKDESTESRPLEDYICSSVEIIREYISDALGDLLDKRLGVDRKRILKKRNSDSSEHPAEGQAKRRRTTNEVTKGPTEDYMKGVSTVEEKKETPKLTAAQKKLVQCDKTGMKSITSFFAKKN